MDIQIIEKQPGIFSLDVPKESHECTNIFLFGSFKRLRGF